MKRALLLVLSVLAGCSPQDGSEARPEDGAPPEALPVVRAQMAAFNRGDVAAMSALVANDVRLLTVAGDSILVGARGRSAFVEQMRSYFRSVEDVESVIEKAMSVGPFVAIRERATWATATGRDTARSLGVYEVRDDSIHGVWYFPAVD